MQKIIIYCSEFEKVVIWNEKSGGRGRVGEKPYIYVSIYSIDNYEVKMQQQKMFV